MTESNQPTDPDLMDEPTECPECHEYFDAGIRENWNSVPFYLTCGHCGQRIWPEHEVKWQER